MNILEGVLSGVGLVIGVPIALLLLVMTIHAVGLEMWKVASEMAEAQAKVRWLQTLLAFVYSVVMTAIAVAMLDAACGRAIM